jgi:hypothetical protein
MFILETGTCKPETRMIFLCALRVLCGENAVKMP